MTANKRIQYDPQSKIADIPEQTKDVILPLEKKGQKRNISKKKNKRAELKSNFT